jgi:hypothetical protein
MHNFKKIVSKIDRSFDKSIIKYQLDQTSSTIKNAAYLEKSQLLIIEFPMNNTYIYMNVPLAVYNKFENSTSKGRFFNSDIKGLYSFKKINNR